MFRLTHISEITVFTHQLFSQNSLEFGDDIHIHVFIGIPP